MLELTTYTELEIAHRLLTSYTARCQHLHGHRYQVEITVSSKDGRLNPDGMIVDFKKLKEIVKAELDDKWDHGACFSSTDPLCSRLMEDRETSRLHIIKANPTLEWMVGHWAEALQAAFDSAQLDLKLVRLTASETARNTVTWTPDGTKVTHDPGHLEIELPDEYKNDLEIERDARVQRPKCEMNEAQARKKIEYLRDVGVLGCKLAPAPECQLKEMEKDTCQDGRSNQQKLGDLMTLTDYPEDVCLKALIDGGWNFARAERNLRSEYAHGRTPWYYRQKASEIRPVTPLMELKETPKIARPEVEVQATTEEDKLRDDEEAYLVSYWPVGYPQPVSGVFATAMRGIALVRTLQAAIDKKHPGGATIISFNRVPR